MVSLTSDQTAGLTLSRSRVEGGGGAADDHGGASAAPPRLSCRILVNLLSLKWNVALAQESPHCIDSHCRLHTIIAMHEKHIYICTKT